MRCRNLMLGMAAFAAILAAQQSTPSAEPRGAALQLVPSGALEKPKPETANKTAPPAAETGVRPAILILKPAGDPIYLEEEPPVESKNWRTYQRPKVEPFSRNGDGVAIQGYDVLSYLEKRAEKGSKEFSAEYAGITWRFATREHLEEFNRDPKRYLPEYGGFCAYSVSRGYPATADPRAFALEQGKLYLFFDPAVRSVWEQDRRRMISAADRTWPELHR